MQCAHCGTVLPKDNMRFCDSCGTPVSSHPVHPEAASASTDDARSSPGSKPTTSQTISSQEKNSPVLREQIAQQPPAHPVRLHSPNHVPRPATRGETFSSPVHERTVDDLPTRPLAAQPPKPPKPPGVFPISAPTVQHAHEDEVALLDTVRLAASLPSMHHQPRIPLLVIAALLCQVVVGALSVWIVLFQPFSVPAITQPQQRFKATDLGLSLLYPSGWTSQVDRAKATVHFYDSSHTAAVMIIVKKAAAGNVTQYLQQQVKQLGMTGAKVGTPLSFAGATWKLMLGSVQLSGANYTEAVLATVHGKHLFTLIQWAPQSIYADEEKLVFSDLRSSLQFV